MDRAERPRATAGLLLTAGLIAVLLLRDSFLGLEFQRLCQVATVIAALSYTAVVRHAPQRQWSAGSIFLLLVLMFHFGLVFLTATHLPVAEADQDYVDLWFGGIYVERAIYLSTLAVLAYAIAYLTARPQRPAEDRAATTLLEAKTVTTIGMLLTVGGVGLYMGYVLLRAPELLSAGSSYDLYLNTVGGAAPLAIGTLMTTFGLVMIAPAPPSSSRRLAMFTFIAYAVIVLPLGVRTAVLFPAAAGVVAAARTRTMPNGRRTLAAILVGLALVGIVRDFRSEDQRTSNLIAAANPFAALSELGGTLRPVAETVSWLEGSANEDRRDGVTYAAPVLRLLERLDTSPSTPPPAINDKRLAVSVLAGRSQPFQLGYSPVAEAFYNFGTVGVLGVFGLLGFAVGWVDRRRGRPLTDAMLAGVVMATIGLSVRNGSNSMLTTLVIGLVLVSGTVLLTRSARVSDAPPRPRSRPLRSQ